MVLQPRLRDPGSRRVASDSSLEVGVPSGGGIRQLDFNRNPVPVHANAAHGMLADQVGSGVGIDDSGERCADGLLGDWL